MIFKNTGSEGPDIRVPHLNSALMANVGMRIQVWMLILWRDSGHQTAAGRELQTPAAGGGLVTSDQ